MTPLSPDLFDTDFTQLVALARARLPQLAPGWTDHNLHDPGIMLIELLAWVTEAQIYSVARVRTDERWAFGALFGMAPGGPVPACGMVWPDAGAPGGALLAVAGSTLDTATPQHPSFRLEQAINITAARLTGVATRLHGGGVIDHTAQNRHGNTGFEPFGPAADPRDELVLSFDGDLLAPDSANDRARDAWLALGVRVAGGTVAALSSGIVAAPAGGTVAAAAGACLRATLVHGQRRYALPVHADGSGGFLRSGVLLLGLQEVPQPLDHFDIVLACADSALAPRILCIRPNVLPMHQRRRRTQEITSSGAPGQTITLDTPGVCFPDAAPEVTVAPDQRHEAWTACADLAAANPDDAVYRFDAERARIVFGNGVNGRIPASGASITVAYDVSEGAAGNLNAGTSWILRGGAGHRYANLDATSGGAPALDLAQLRRQARAIVRDAHPIVTAADLEAAALALPGLGVARAHSVAPDHASALPAAWVLVALREWPADAALDTPRWLAHVQRALAPQVLLGERLQVRAPAYAPVAVAATLVLRPGLDATDLQERVFSMLADYFRLVDRAGGPVWPLGRPVRVRDLQGWLLRVDGVLRVVACTLSSAGKQVDGDGLTLARTGLPLFQRERSVVTFASGGALP